MTARTRMYLVRHGATPANLQKPARLQGRSDVALDPLGVRQAEATRSALAEVSFAATYCSPLIRAVRTAEIIAPYREPIPVDALIECNVGRWEGVDWDTIRRDDAEAFARYMADPAADGYPGGENFEQVITRVLPAFDELFARHVGESFLVVSHHVVNRTFLAATLGLPMRHGRSVSLDNCGVSVVVEDAGKRRVKSLNQTLHLGPLHVDE
ncbi:MAG: histidine phosphatase family protein [Gemmataceae bacterium]|nr:histidine phosphatase family protein [Gemmataceae bacterium]